MEKFSNDKLLKIIVFLWDKLDDIDTYAELCINGSETDKQFREIIRKASKRFLMVQSDGHYDLYLDGTKITNYQKEEEL